MIFDFSVDGKVKIIMEEYIWELLEEAPDNMAGVCAMPAANHLFEVNNQPVLLSKERSDLFHHLTAKLLCTYQRGHDQIFKQLWHF
jgi:hypothetical protein